MVETIYIRYADAQCVQSLRGCLPKGAPHDYLPGTEHLVAITNSGELVGCVSVTLEALQRSPWKWHRLSRAYSLWGLYVTENNRNQGVGAGLLRAAIQTCRMDEARIVWSRSEENEFLKKNGFEDVMKPKRGPGLVDYDPSIVVADLSFS